MTQFRMIANEFGATPASRSKPVPVEDRKESANPFAKFA
jgi:phage terminase small subunit